MIILFKNKLISLQYENLFKQVQEGAASKSSNLLHNYSYDIKKKFRIIICYNML
jgi:hypothetical protein